MAEEEKQGGRQMAEALKKAGVLKNPEEPLAFGTKEEATEHLKAHIPEEKRNVIPAIETPVETPAEFKVVRHEPKTGEPILGTAEEKKKPQKFTLEQLVKIAKKLGISEADIPDPKADWVNPVIKKLFDPKDTDITAMAKEERERLKSLIKETEKRVQNAILLEAKVMGVPADQVKGTGLLQLKEMIHQRLAEVREERKRQEAGAEARELEEARQKTLAAQELGPKKKAKVEPPPQAKRGEQKGPEEPGEQEKFILPKDQAREQHKLTREILKRARLGKLETADQEMFQGSIAKLRDYYRDLLARTKLERLTREIQASLEDLTRREQEFQETVGQAAKTLNLGDLNNTWKILHEAPEVPDEGQKSLIKEAIERLKGHYQARQALVRRGDAKQKIEKNLRDLLGLEQELDKPMEQRMRSSKAYQFLERQYLRGISLEEMKGKIINRKTRSSFLPKEISREQWSQALQMLEQEIAQGRDPLERMAADITTDFLEKEGNYQELNAATVAESQKKFPEVVKAVWRNFVYGAKTDQGIVRSGLRGKDLDVKVSLWLLERAGIKAATQAQPVPQGTMEAGAFNIDTSGQSGLFRHVDKKMPTYKTFELPEQPPSGADDHPHGRVLPSSTAKILLEGLKQCGLFEEQYEEKAKDRKARVERRAVEMMVRLTVDGDNVTFPVSKQGRLADYKKSSKTLLGLSRYMTANQIFDYFKRYGQDGRFKDAYASAVVERELTTEDIERYRLNKRGKDSKTGKATTSPLEKAAKAVEDAEAKLGKPWQALGREERESLYRTGKVMDTRFGTYVVDLVRKKSDKLRGGYAAVQAYGYDGYIIYDRNQNFYLINTFRERIDLSRDQRLQGLPQKTIVRGNILIKSGLPDEDLKVKFVDVLRAVAKKNYRPATEIQKYLEEETFVEREVEWSIKDEYKESLKKTILDNLTKQGKDVAGRESQLELYLEKKANEFLERVGKTQPERIRKLREVVRTHYYLDKEMKEMEKYKQAV